MVEGLLDFMGNSGIITAKGRNEKAAVALVI